MYRHILIFLFCLVTFPLLSHPNKVLICGICKNIEHNGAVYVSITNIEQICSHFDDYAVIIYENNSTDKTVEVLNNWAKYNSRVTFISENLAEDQLPGRMEAISRARNIVLSVARDSKYDDFEHIIMADLDFIHPWSVDEIVRTTQLAGDWDCISTNGIFAGKLYWDRFAFRDIRFPFGPELIGNRYWRSFDSTWFEVNKWIPVYSAFGGLAIYKRNSIINFSYSPTVTEDVEKYYLQIFSTLRKKHPDYMYYMKINNLKCGEEQKTICFRNRECCEHLTIHASMAVNGFGKFYINPQMYMNYGLGLFSFSSIYGNDN